MQIEVYMRVKCHNCTRWVEEWFPAEMGHMPGRLRQLGWHVKSNELGMFNPREDSVYCPNCTYVDTEAGDAS